MGGVKSPIPGVWEARFKSKSSNLEGALEYGFVILVNPQRKSVFWPFSPMVNPQDKSVCWRFSLDFFVGAIVAVNYVAIEYTRSAARSELLQAEQYV